MRWDAATGYSHVECGGCEVLWCRGVVVLRLWGVECEVLCCCVDALWSTVECHGVVECCGMLYGVWWGVLWCSILWSVVWSGVLCEVVSGVGCGVLWSVVA